MNLNEGRDDWAELLAELQAEEAPSALEDEESAGHSGELGGGAGLVARCVL